MTATDTLKMMGGVQKDLLARLPVDFADAHPSTREALITRGVAERIGPGDDSDSLVITEHGIAVRAALRSGS